MEKYVACQFNIGRVRTDFWIWNSRLFPDFFQNNNFFFQTQGYQIGDQKMKEQSFFHDALQTCRRDWIRFDQHKKKFTCKALIVTFKKKNQDFVPLSRLYLYFTNLENCWGNLKTFSRFEDSVRTLLQILKESALFYWPVHLQTTPVPSLSQLCHCVAKHWTALATHTRQQEQG